MHRYKMACTQKEDFVKNAKNLRTAMLDKGYEIKTVDKYCGKFLRRHMPQVPMKSIKSHRARGDVQKTKHGPGTTQPDATNHENDNAGRRAAPPRQSSPPKRKCDAADDKFAAQHMECDCNNLC